VRVAVADTLVLCYHAVSPTWPAKVAVTPDALRRQVGGLLARGYRPRTFAELAAAPPERRTLVVTFDDAYRSVRTHALPVLRELGVPATVFACTDFTGSERPVPMGRPEWEGTPHEHELVPMGWDELRSLADAGWEVGSHTRSHPNLKRLDDARLAAELGGSRAACAEAMGRPCATLAYPYGDHDARVVAAAGAAGYLAACTTFPGWAATPPPLEWPRVIVNRHHDGARFRLKSAGAVRRLRSSRLGDGLTGLAYRRRSGSRPRPPGRGA
jgi:peptidoglycan/xylan/chitin deacetylase (PgdA/CDA1 family)